MRRRRVVPPLDPVEWFSGVPDDATARTGQLLLPAVYFGDDNYFPSNPDRTVCETFTVAKDTPPVATVVFDGSSKGPWTGDETTGATGYDTATVTGVTPPPPQELVTPAATPDVALPRFTPTGTVTYRFFTSGSCTGDPSWTDTVDLSAGKVPPSQTTDPLGGGTYSFDAVYSGDANYNTNTSPCEPFTVDPAQPVASTTVFDGSTHAAWSGTEVTGATAYDTSTVTGVEGFTPTGTVTYVLYDNGTCAAPDELALPGSVALSAHAVIGTDTVTLAGGLVPDSAPTAPLGAGPYSYRAVYSGDDNYSPAVMACEPFTVDPAQPNASTTVFDGSTHAAWSGTEVTGATAYDTSTVTGVEGFAPTGTVTYTLYDNGTCAVPGEQGVPANDASSPHAVISTDTVTLAAGLVPNSATTAPLGAGSYSYRAVYSGDTNYSPTEMRCEPLTVGKATAATATIVFDASSNAAWSGTEGPGATAYDTSTVTGVSGITPTGTVTYSFFGNGVCSGSGLPTVVTLAGGTAPHSATTDALATGSYSFDAVYGGDSNYHPEASACEPLTVAAVTSAATTVSVTPTPPQPTTSPAVTSPLAFTGANLSSMVADGILLIGLGGLMVLATRRRRARRA